MKSQSYIQTNGRNSNHITSLEILFSQHYSKYRLFFYNHPNLWKDESNQLVDEKHTRTSQYIEAGRHTALYRY